MFLAKRYVHVLSILAGELCCGHVEFWCCSRILPSPNLASDLDLTAWNVTVVDRMVKNLGSQSAKALVQLIVQQMMEILG